MKDEKNFPRILILSNQSLSLASSNGRTIYNFLIGWPKENLAQFFTSSEIPDYSLCSNYLSITDSDVINYFIRKRKNKELNNNSNSINVKSKNALTKLLREFIWGLYISRNRKIEDWVSCFKPDLILLQAGDSGFMCKLAVKLKDKFSIPLIVYNSENYYFKNYDYFRSKGLSHLLYPIFHYKFCSNFKKMMKKSDYAIYNSISLEKKYSFFNVPSKIIYTSSFLTKNVLKKYEKNPNDLVISYLGNLGVGRSETLVTLSEKIIKHNSKIKLNVYGKAPNDIIRSQLMGCDSIIYHGFVSYTDVINIMKNSDLLIHVENFSEFYVKDLTDSFSTKIADTIASGIPFLFFGPENTVGSKYLKENGCAHVANNESELDNTLYKIINDSSYRFQYVDRGLEVASENHNVEKNADLFYQIIKKITKKVGD